MFKYFIIFDATVNGIIFLINFDFGLFILINYKYNCMLILYPATLLNLIMGCNRFLVQLPPTGPEPEPRSSYHPTLLSTLCLPVSF